MVRNYKITLTGSTDLIFHWDNIEWADHLIQWREDPDNKARSKAGDDRSPAWTWIGSVYNNGTHVSLPQDNLMRCLMEGGAMVVVPGGKHGKTFKSQTQSGLMIDQPHWALRVNGQTIPMDRIRSLHETNEMDFQIHQRTAQELGFSLLVKRAAIGRAKHVRVRPIFRDWSAQGTVTVLDDQITEKSLRDIFERSGMYKGLGDWRPGGKTPGPYGRFKAVIKAA